MRAADGLGLMLGALRGHRSRSLMLLLAMAIGVVAVNLLTGLAEGARQFVIGEFSLLGRNPLIVLPGRKETSGGIPPRSARKGLPSWRVGSPASSSAGCMTMARAMATR